ncbi:unnamed protein product [Leptidea sinapis]|nr:unnamed protein product [Leptidea sinapis]
MALQEQSTLVKRFMEVRKSLEMGELDVGVNSGQQLIRAVSGRPGLISQEKVLKLLILLAPNHPDVERLEQQLKTLQIQEDKHSPEPTDQTVEEDI